MFENRVLRRVFASKMVKMTGGWRKLHNKVLHNLYSSQNIIRMIKSRRKRLVWHVARTGRNAYGILMGKQKERDP
jgi:hypothetical protein